MQSINTTKIGDEFEKCALDILKNALLKEQLGHNGKYCKIYSKKGYYSPERKDYIKFDLTVEVWPPNSDRYSFIYFIECKSYSTSVPVGQIEKFLSEIRQVSGYNSKGVFITNSPLQKSAYNMAESCGLMVIAGNSENNYQILLHKEDKINSRSSIPFIQDSIDTNILNGNLRIIEEELDRLIKSSIAAFLNKFQSNNIKYYNKEAIAGFAKKELYIVCPNVEKGNNFLNPYLLKEYLAQKHGIKITTFSNESKFLGNCSIKDGIIGIRNDLVGTSRELFVLAHEYAHFVLHKDILIDQDIYEGLESTDFNYQTGKNELKNAKNWLEWQANYFASSLILPKFLCIAVLKYYLQQENNFKDFLYIDDQYHNIKFFNSIIEKVAIKFSTTKTTVTYKLKEFNLMVDNRKTKLVGQLIHENKDFLNNSPASSL